MAGTRKNTIVYNHESTTLGDLTIRHNNEDFLAVWLKDQIVWDTITPTYNATSDVYVFTLSSVTQATITINYTDATKAVISSITRV